MLNIYLEMAINVEINLYLNKNKKILIWKEQRPYSVLKSWCYYINVKELLPGLVN